MRTHDLFFLCNAMIWKKWEKLLWSRKKYILKKFFIESKIFFISFFVLPACPRGQETKIYPGKMHFCRMIVTGIIVWYDIFLECDKLKLLKMND